MGVGETALVISSIIRKRDLSALWEWDPVAAPPRSVQRRLLAPTTTTTPHDQPQAERRERAGGNEQNPSSQEHRAVLELQLQFAMRRQDTGRVRILSRQLRSIDEHNEARAPIDVARARQQGELRVGDECFALGKLVEWEWYHAVLLHVRERTPSLQIKYIGTHEGETASLALPVPRIAYVPLEYVRLDKPEPSEEPVTAPITPCVRVREPCS